MSLIYTQILCRCMLAILLYLFSTIIIHTVIIPRELAPVSIDSRLPIVGNGITGTKEAFFDKRNYLGDCYPNPVVDKAVFSFRMNAQSMVKLEILDIQGKLIRTIVEQVHDAGLHHITYDLKFLKTGTYLYRLKSGSIEKTKKFVKH